ncbi:hypothetical protein D9758_001569 [Tetrapyrgos nigripes]|uniref:Uncharacterized protein n=1 Tax=Tetrapyrgos nigripes TaxID=182062 RepID=A0A8H5GYC2_9AGAR|nr:hypothetical protein D9758_001569 [Tetrapyrgos nigripes]
MQAPRRRLKSTPTPQPASHDDGSADSQTMDQEVSLSGKLLTYEELPLWRRDNPSILTGYRPETKSWLSCAKGAAIWHNESVNIWTHLLGTMATIAAIAVSFSEAGFLEKNLPGFSLDSAELMLFLNKYASIVLEFAVRSH